MACQFPSAIGSNYVYGSILFFNPNMLSGQLTFEKDEIFNTCGEREDRQVIPKFDHANDTTNSEDNDSYSSDKNDEYIELTCSDSAPYDYEDVGVRYTSIETTVYDEPNKKDTIDEPIGVRETCMNRQWKILGLEDYSIQTILTVMSATSNNGIYKGRMFVSKEKLNMTLGLFALKEKFEYRIRRSIKTHFEVSYKYIGCKFQLHAIEVQNKFY